MAVEINQLKIKGTINDGKTESSLSKNEIEKLIESKIGNNSGSHLNESFKRQLIEECVREVLKAIEDKMSY